MARGIRTVRRPGDADSPAFDLAYVREHEGASSVPVGVIPGGPGLASIRVYAGFRRSAPDLDLLMVEHRGVGHSRKDLTGADLPPSAMTVTAAVDDIAAVLNAEHIDRAVIVGSSYGTYLAQGFGIRHPERVHAMVLDSTMLSAEDHHEVRAHARSLLWEGESAGTAAAAAQIRTLVEDRGIDPLPLGLTSAVLYDLAGPERLERYLGTRTHPRTGLIDVALRTFHDGGLTRPIRYVMEFDLVGHLAMRELQFAPEPDGLIFDPAYETAALADRFPAYQGEPFDLPAALPHFDWPLVVLSGERDLQTPPSLGLRAAELAPQGRFIDLPGVGHGALEAHPAALLAAVRELVTGRSAGLQGLARSGLVRHLAPVVGGLLVIDRVWLTVAGAGPWG
ncbi:Pimeloyl-ACP methyl ester carboxylesterase [Raineyella antarctica]|uniref:Pimeloyl-ACP methyl ester carboxylesterase n=1 Tax=Raineyella antarctica TaxID=1577474 RepID=A0A1G6HG43_9ACTN|nr:alpha/beta hydrolase [Raineyella antarctica]SDB92895.1 Pimeloyl-ACP methyl ester carboxylesterase [Raineyella antarctica]